MYSEEQLQGVFGLKNNTNKELPKKNKPYFNRRKMKTFGE